MGRIKTRILQPAAFGKAGGLKQGRLAGRALDTVRYARILPEIIGGARMPAYARREIVAETEVGVYHCVSRCCAAPFSAGKAPSLAAVSIHLKGWIQSRLEELAGIFAVDVLGFSVMSNHISF
jgi:hypothetical protein